MSWENTVRPSFIDHSFRVRGMAVEYRKLQIDDDRFHLQFLGTWLLTQNFVPNVRTLLICLLFNDILGYQVIAFVFSNIQGLWGPRCQLTVFIFNNLTHRKR